jgi:hypothetical protein
LKTPNGRLGERQRAPTAHMKVGATTLLEAEANGCGREDLLGEWK